ncbi:MAG: hypothetical protein QW568_03580 [Candidatus Anstonellaceae archaeon]
MADSSDPAVPDFATACARAREMEKNLLAAKPSPISGSLSVHPDEEIFPQEYESYTYAYLLSEAQKVERKLYMSGLQTSLSSQKPGAKPIDEAKLEADLHKFASAGELPQAPTLPQEKLQATIVPPSKAKPGGIKLPEIPIGKKKAEQPLTPPQPPEVSASKQPTSAGFSVTQTFRAKPPPIPLTPEEAHEAEEVAEESVPKEALEFEREHPGWEPPEEEPEKIETEADFIEPSKEPQFSSKKQGEKIGPQSSEISGGEEEKLAVEREISEPSAQQAQAPASSASKLSPRLREIIEAKIRREEERKKKEAEILEGIELKPQEEEETGKGAAQQEAQAARQEEEIVLSARERLLRKLQKQSAEKTKQISPPEPAMQEQEEVAEQPVEEVAADEEHEPPAVQERIPARKPKPSLQEPSPPIISPAPVGGITIQPIFAGEESKAQSQPEKPVVESERLRKIQRIIEELSPDKYKAGAIAPKEEAQEKEQAPAPVQKAKQRLRLEQAEEEQVPASKAKPKPSPKQFREEEEQEEPPKLPKAKQKLLSAQEEVEQPVPKPILQKGKVAPKTAPKALAKRPQAKKKAAKETVEVSKKGKGKTSQKPLARKPAATEEEMPARPQAKRVLPARAEPEQEEEEPPTIMQRKRILPREEAAESREEEEQPAIAPKKRVLPQAPEPEEEAPHPKRSRAFPTPQTQREPVPIKVGKRILPGGLRQQAQEEEAQAPETYVPPARQKLIPKMRHGETEEESMPQEEAEEESLPQKPRMQTREEESESEGERARAPVQKIPAKLSPDYGRAIPKKAADDSLPEEASPDQIAEWRRRQQNAAALAAKLSSVQSQEKPLAVPSPPPFQGTPLSAKKTHDIAGEASLPDEEEEKIDETEIPKPPQEGQGAAPVDYSMAKGEFKRKLEDVEVKEKAKEQTDEFVEQYAKENLVWLYEIYKMGGMTRDDFMQKAREKLQESSQGASQESEPEAENPALSNLERELEKKKK